MKEKQVIRGDGVMDVEHLHIFHAIRNEVVHFSIIDHLNEVDDIENGCEVKVNNIHDDEEIKVQDIIKII